MIAHNVTIIGTGLSGLAMAAAIAHHDIDVTLIGPDLDAQHDGRTTAILAPNVDFLKKINLWNTAKMDATPLLTMELIDGDSSYAFHCAEMGLNAFGFNVHNHALKTSLLNAITKNPRIRWKKTTLKSAAQNTDGWDLILGNGTKIRTTLLIGADGRHSMVRDAASISISEKPEHQAALVTLLQASKPHHNISVERYRSGGPFTLVPCADQKLALVWCDDETLLKEKCKASLKDLGVEITDITQKQFGTLTVLNPPQLWPVRPLSANRMIAANTALIGEAAHVLPPIGAQGFNTSLSDIIALTETLFRARRLGLPLYDATLLQEYEAKRQPAILARYHGITRLNDMIRANNPVANHLRRVSLQILTRITPLKKRIMQMGLGRKSA